MGARLLVMGAGSAGAENLSAGLRAGDRRLALLGCHHDRFILKNSSASACFLVPSENARGFARALTELVARHSIDLIIPTTDGHVLALSGARRTLGGKLFLPAPATIALCQDKLLLARALHAAGLPAPRTVAVRGLGGVREAFARLGRGPLWCRPRTGACARGGGKVASPAEARRWIQIWQDMQGLRPSTFTLSEYLPGREILCQSVWKNGRMIVADTYERLAYFGTDNIPSGVTSLSSLAKTVREPGVVELCREAIARLAPRASGPFSIDTKEDGRGRQRITEINAGRLFMSMTAFDPVLRQSIALAYVRTGLGQHLGLKSDYAPTEDYYMVRDMDVRPGLFHADELFVGIEVGPERGERWVTAGRRKVKRTKSRSSSRAR